VSKLVSKQHPTNQNEQEQLMRMNYSDIKSELLENWEQFESTTDPHGLLNQFADSACPIYYGEIISDWQEMPNEFTDSWQEFYEATGVEGKGITALMSVDLWNYYVAEYTRIYDEILDEKESEPTE
jgi:hypothetical protein